MEKTRNLQNEHSTTATAPEILTYPHRLLRKKTAQVKQIAEEVKTIADKMVEIMFRAEGIGLAAPQIGVSKRIVTMNVKDDFQILVNPHLVEESDETETRDEGCLSLPGVEAPVERPLNVTVKATDLDGNEITLTREGLAARALIHELDHLDGKLFIDHLTDAARTVLLKEYRNNRHSDKPNSKTDQRENHQL